MAESNITVVIPTYNNISYLADTIASILNQTLPPDEVIVVDDGSTCLSVSGFRSVKDFVMRLGSSRLQCVEQENKGAPAARNAGAAQAQSEWLAFCDSDDLWLPTKLQRQITLLQKAPDCHCCIVDFQNFDVNGTAPRSHFDYAPEAFWNEGRRDFGAAGFVLDRNLFLDYLTFQPAITSTVLIRRGHFEKIGRWNPAVGHMQAEDFEFHLRCARHPPIAVVPEVLMKYRKHVNSMSANELMQAYVSIEILRYVLENEELAKANAPVFRTEIETRLLECCRSAFFAARPDLFRKWYAELPGSCRSMGLRARYLFSLLPGNLPEMLLRAVRAARD